MQRRTSIALASAVVAAGLFAAAGEAAAQARIQGEGSRMYFYEEFVQGRLRWGWSDSPRAISRRAATHPARTIREACARHVGRTLQTDSSSLTQSTRMTEECIRNGGPDEE